MTYRSYEYLGKKETEEKGGDDKDDENKSEVEKNINDYEIHCKEYDDIDSNSMSNDNNKNNNNNKNNGINYHHDDKNSDNDNNANDSKNDNNDSEDDIEVEIEEDLKENIPVRRTSEPVFSAHSTMKISSQLKSAQTIEQYSPILAPDRGHAPQPPIERNEGKIKNLKTILLIKLFQII